MCVYVCVCVCALGVSLGLDCLPIKSTETATPHVNAPSSTTILESQPFDQNVFISAMATTHSVCVCECVCVGVWFRIQFAYFQKQIKTNEINSMEQI